jgi:hypothetical protein
MKKWYESKTIIFNIILAILGFLPMLNEDLLALFGVSNPTRYFKIIGAIVTIGNYFLRFVTDKPIGSQKIKGNGAVIPNKGF